MTILFCSYIDKTTTTKTTEMKTTIFYSAFTAFCIAMCMDAQTTNEIFTQASILLVSGVIIKKTYGDDNE